MTNKKNNNYISMSFKFINIPFQINGEVELIKSLVIFWKDMLNDISVNISIPDNDSWKIHIRHINIEKEKVELNHSSKIIFYKVPIKEELFVKTISLMREIIVKISLMEGYNWLHASAFNINNKTFLVLGNKGDGKTTWLMNALYNKNADFIGNDQIPILYKNGKLYVYRWRPDIKISPDTLVRIGIDYKVPSSVKIDRFILMPYANQYEFIDFKSWSKQNRQTIYPFPIDFEYNISNQENLVTGIIFLNNTIDYPVDIIDSDKKNDLFDKYFHDPEVIFSEQLQNWEKNKKYWLRIQNLYAPQKILNASNRCKKYLKNEIPVYLVSNRMNIEKINSFIDRLTTTD